MKISNFFYNLNDKYNINKRIVVLSDIHYYNKYNLKKLSKVLNIVSKHRPDYICIPGDLVDKRYVKDETGLIDWLEKLSQVAYVIISIGNHEFYNSKRDYDDYNKQLFSKIAKINNCYVLENDVVTIGRCNFIGICLSGQYYYEYIEKNPSYLIETVNREVSLPKSGYNILLCHSPIEILNPEVFNNIKFSMDINLVLCGHTHGGMTPNFLKNIFKGRGIINPQNRLFAKNNYGHYKINDTDCIISSGITKSSHSNKFDFLDFLFSPEITVIDIKNK